MNRTLLRMSAIDLVFQDEMHELANAHHDRIHYVKAACCNQTTETALPYYGEGQGASLFSRSGDRSGYQVEVLILSKLIADVGRELDKGDQFVVKIDLEGLEFALLPEILMNPGSKRVTQWFIDWHNNIIPRYTNEDKEILLRQFRKLKAVSHHWEPGGAILDINLEPNQLDLI